MEALAAWSPAPNLKVIVADSLMPIMPQGFEENQNSRHGKSAPLMLILHYGRHNLPLLWNRKRAQNLDPGSKLDRRLTYMWLRAIWRGWRAAAGSSVRRSA